MTFLWTPGVKDFIMLKISIEAVAQTCFVKSLFLEISLTSQGNTYARASFLIKLQAWGLPLY